MLYVNVTYAPDSEPPGQLIWRHNGVVINQRRNPRATFLSNGSLIVNDTGTYTLVISNTLGCQSFRFNIFPECECLIINYASDSIKYSNTLIPCNIIKVCNTLGLNHS